MSAAPKTETRARLEAMAAQAVATPLNVTQEARELTAAITPQPRTLTTADIGAFATQLLSQARENAAANYSRALAQAGDKAALQCSYRIDFFGDQAEDVGLLEALASMHGDEHTAATIRADLKATRELLIDQAHVARMVSVPGWDVDTRSFMHHAPVQQVGA